MAMHILLVLIKEPEDVLKENNNLSVLNHLRTLSSWISRYSRNAKFTLRKKEKKKEIKHVTKHWEEKCIIRLL